MSKPVRRTDLLSTIAKVIRAGITVASLANERSSGGVHTHA